MQRGARMNTMKALPFAVRSVISKAVSFVIGRLTHTKQSNAHDLLSLLIRPPQIAHCADIHGAILCSKLESVLDCC